MRRWRRTENFGAWSLWGGDGSAAFLERGSWWFPCRRRRHGVRACRGGWTLLLERRPCGVWRGWALSERVKCGQGSLSVCIFWKKDES